MIIFIDPGHGGNDSGAVGPTGLMEKDVNLSISLIVSQMLEKHGVDARLTRSDDRRVELLERVNIANNNKGDYFISIHMNSASNATANGTETFAYHKSALGNRLAKLIQSNLVKEIGLANRGVKNRDLLVLRETNMPAALVEVAFINNPEEEKLMRDKNFIKKAAVGIVKGILEFSNIEYKEDSNENNISNWAKEAMEWATSEAVGITDGSRPKELITLERMVNILYRYHKLGNK